MMKQTERTMKDTVASDEAKLPPEAQDRIHKAVQRWRAELLCLWKLCPRAACRRAHAAGGSSRHDTRSTTMKTAIVTALLLTALPAGALAMDHIAVQPNTLKWGPAPPGLPPGAQVAVVAGDPSKDGPYVVRA